MGTMAEHYVRGVKPLYANLHAYNRWLDETWGFDFQGRIYAPAVLSLRDLDSAVAEVDYVLERGAELIMLNAGPAVSPVAGRSVLRPLLGPAQRGRGDRGVPHR